ncbi:hypothetical protein ACQ4LE_002693 [Meloidogyne hapla]
MGDSDSQKNSKNKILDIFKLARKQLEERRKIDNEQEQRWTIIAKRKINEGFDNGKENSDYLENIKSMGDDSTLIFCGAPNSGKSTLLSRFMEFGTNSSTIRQKSFEKSIALEYKFVKKILRENDRQLIHCWELAGGGSMANLIEIPFNQPFKIASLFLFVDLTKPEQFQQIIDPIMSICRKQVEKWTETSLEPQKEKNEESKIIKPLGIPLVLVCARYDDFQNFESERKRVTYRLIRQFAHVNGASIITFSPRIDSLMQRALLLLSNAISNSPFSKTFATDPQQPLFVLPHGIDSFEKIDPSTESLINSINSYSEAMFNYTQTLNSYFPQLPQQIVDYDGGDEGDRRQQFDEPTIDLFVVERMRKLELHIRELQDRLQTEKKLENQQNILN